MKSNKVRGQIPGVWTHTVQKYICNHNPHYTKRKAYFLFFANACRNPRKNDIYNLNQSPESQSPIPNPPQRLRHSYS